MLETLMGNEAVRQNLAAALQSGHLAHSVLLCGEEGCGVNYAARCLAADYLYPSGGNGAQQVMQGKSTEVLLVEGEGASGDIKVDRVRAVRKELFGTALSAGGRVVLIRAAHRMAAPSANALLKVLEEPPAGVLFVLTAPSEAAVLATIRSRCAVYTVSPVSPAACSAYLQKALPQMQPADANELADLFGGKIGAALASAPGGAHAKMLADAKALWAAAQAHDSYTAQVVLAAYEKDRAAARRLLALFQQLCGRALHNAAQAQIAAACLPFVRQADMHLAANVSQKLVLTVLAAKL